MPDDDGAAMDVAEEVAPALDDGGALDVAEEVAPCEVADGPEDDGVTAVHSPRPFAPSTQVRPPQHGKDSKQ